MIVILPTIVTIWVIIFIFKLFGNQAGHFINIFLGDRMSSFIEVVLGFVLAISLITIIGYLAKNSFLKQIAQVLEKKITSIPFIDIIYTSTKKVIKSITIDNTAFKRVVFIEFPRKGIYTVGFITKEYFPNIIKETTDQADNVAIFVPTAPNPTSGFTLIVNRKDLIQTDLTVEEGLKMVVSVGVLVPDLVSIQKKLEV